MATDIEKGNKFDAANGDDDDDDDDDQWEWEEDDSPTTFAPPPSAASQHTDNAPQLHQPPTSSATAPPPSSNDRPTAPPSTVPRKNVGQPSATARGMKLSLGTGHTWCRLWWLQRTDDRMWGRGGRDSSACVLLVSLCAGVVGEGATPRQEPGRMAPRPSDQAKTPPPYKPQAPEATAPRAVPDSGDLFATLGMDAKPTFKSGSDASPLTDAGTTAKTPGSTLSLAAGALDSDATVRNWVVLR